MQIVPAINPATVAGFIVILFSVIPVAAKFLSVSQAPFFHRLHVMLIASSLQKIPVADLWGDGGGVRGLTPLPTPLGLPSEHVM